jgi:hypothetical protein
MMSEAQSRSQAYLDHFGRLWHVAVRDIALDAVQVVESPYVRRVFHTGSYCLACQWYK